MKVAERRGIEKKFSEIKVGDVFRDFNCSNFCMKIHEKAVEYYDEEEEYECVNAVDLQNGETFCCSCSDTVELFNAELTIL